MVTLTVETAITYAVLTEVEREWTDEEWDDYDSRPDCENIDLYEEPNDNEIRDQLLGEPIAVKQGEWGNRLWGTITAVEPYSPIEQSN